MQKKFNICKEKLEGKHAKDKNYCKIRDHYYYTNEYRGVTHIIWSLKFSAPNEIPTVFHDTSNYDNHFIIKDLVEEFKWKFRCLGENAKKYTTLQIKVKSYKNW